MFYLSIETLNLKVNKIKQIKTGPYNLVAMFNFMHSDQQERKTKLGNTTGNTFYVIILKILLLFKI